MRNEKYPIYFNNGTCAACGAAHVIKQIDKFDREAKKTDIFPIYRMHCSACGRDFFIRWDQMDDENHTAIPIPVSKSVIGEFMEDTRKEQKEREKELQIPYDRYEVTDLGTF